MNLMHLNSPLSHDRPVVTVPLLYCFLNHTVMLQTKIPGYVAGICSFPGIIQKNMPLVIANSFIKVAMHSSTGYDKNEGNKPHKCTFIDQFSTYWNSIHLQPQLLQNFRYIAKLLVQQSS